jgi:hypothetical protein
MLATPIEPTKSVKVVAIACSKEGALFILVNSTGIDKVLPVGNTEWHIIHEQDEAIFKKTQE